MRIVLESLRFVFIFSVLLTIIGVVFHLALLSIGFHADAYAWIGMVSSLILTFILYRNRGWEKVFDRKILCTSVILIIFLSLLIPDASPLHLHTTKYSYSYGFPFQFLTLYMENGTNFVIPNLFS